MVDISDKPRSTRKATAGARVCMNEQAHQALRASNNKKGDVLATVRIAGIQAAKRTSELIPLCHPVSISACQVEIAEPVRDGEDFVIELRATASASDATGVEMEALTAVSVAALTLYDMLKAVDRGLRIERIQLLSKEGGRRGSYKREGL